MLDRLKKIDWSIVLILACFMVISTMLVYSATVDDTKIHIDIKKNLINFTIGFIGLFALALFDFRAIVKISPYTYLFGIALLVGVLFTERTNGARSWFQLPIIGTFQPAELMKLVLIVAIAAFLKRRDGEPLRLLRDVVPICLMVLAPFGLILMQPDLGNAVILIVILLGMLWIGNVKFMHVLLGTVIVSSAIGLFLYSFVHFHEPVEAFMEKMGGKHWVGRIDTFLNPDNASKDEKYQVVQSMIAIGSGALKGDGFMNGNSVHQGFIPYAYSDSIFVVLGEELGFIGGAVVLLLYFILIYRMILIAIQTFDLSGSYIIVGVVSLFVFQIFENIGMLIGLMPLTGITLPFISYGGTSLLINMASVGIIMSIRIHQEKPSMFQEA